MVDRARRMIQRAWVCTGWSRRFAASVIVSVIVLSGGCGGTASEPLPAASPTPQMLTIEDVYERTQRSLNRPGMVYRAVITGQNAPAPATLWVDALRDVTRQEVGGATEGTTTISTADGTYIVTPYDPRAAIARIDPIVCPQTSLAVAVTLGCPDGPFETYVLPDLQQVTATPEVSVVPEEREGRRAVLVVARREQQPWRSGPVVETRRLYLDAESFLPLVEDVERERGGQTERERVTYQHEFVPADTLPADFFDPLSLRALRPDPEQGLSDPSPGFTLYWLGEEVEAIDGVPQVELWASDRYDITSDRSQNDQITLYYTRAEDPFGSTWLFTLTEYSHDVWKSLAAGTHDPSGPCWTRDDLSIAGGTATIFRGYSWPDNVPPPPEDGCPTDRPNDQFLAHVFLGDTVIVVSPWDWPDQTLDGIVAIIQTLTPRD